MNIEISDKELSDLVQKELSNTVSSYGSKPILEQAVRSALQHVLKDKIMALLKDDSNYVDMLNELIQKSVLESFTNIANRISKDLGESLVSALRSEFGAYD